MRLPAWCEPRNAVLEWRTGDACGRGGPGGFGREVLRLGCVTDLVLRLSRLEGRGGVGRFQGLRMEVEEYIGGRSLSWEVGLSISGLSSWSIKSILYSRTFTLGHRSLSILQAVHNHLCSCAPWSCRCSPSSFESPAPISAWLANPSSRSTRDCVCYLLSLTPISVNHAHLLRSIIPGNMPGIRSSFQRTDGSVSMFSSCLSQPTKTVVDQDESLTMFSLSQRVPTEPMQITVEQSTLKAAAEVCSHRSDIIPDAMLTPKLQISRWTITKTALRGRLGDAYGLRHKRADAQLSLMTDEAMDKEFNSLVSKLSADLVGIAVTGVGLVILPQVALTFTINIAKSVHHIRRLVDLVEEFHIRGLGVPKNKIAIKCATGALIKLAILALTLGHADFLSDLVGLDHLHTLFNSIFDPSQVGLGDSWASTLSGAADAHAQWLAEHPHIQSIQGFFSAPVDVVKTYLFPDPAVDSLQWTWGAGEGGESVAQVGQLLVQDGYANGHSAAFETAEIVIGTNLANAVAEHSAGYLLEAPVEAIGQEAEDQLKSRPAKRRLFRWTK